MTQSEYEERIASIREALPYPHSREELLRCREDEFHLTIEYLIGDQISRHQQYKLWLATNRILNPFVKPIAKWIGGLFLGRFEKFDASLIRQLRTAYKDIIPGYLVDVLLEPDIKGF